MMVWLCMLVMLELQLPYASGVGGWSSVLKGKLTGSEARVVCHGELHPGCSDMGVTHG